MFMTRHTTYYVHAANVDYFTNLYAYEMQVTTNRTSQQCLLHIYIYALRRDQEVDNCTVHTST